MGKVTKYQSEIQRAYERKKLLLKSEQVQSRLNNSDKKIAFAMCESLPIIQIANDELAAKIEMFMQTVYRELGIKGAPDEIDLMIFIKYLRSTYQEFTINEILLAFKMLLSGDLDQFLPSNNGIADRGHYQSFSAEYFTKVLNAYRSRKNELIFKAERIEPEPNQKDDIIKAENKKALRQMIYEQYILFCEGQTPRFPVEFIVVQELIKCGLIDKVNEPTHDDIQQARERLLFSPDRWLRMDIRQGGEPERFNTEARIVAMQNQIYEAFLLCMRNKTNLKSLLCL